MCSSSSKRADTAVNDAVQTPALGQLVLELRAVRDALQALQAGQADLRETIDHLMRRSLERDDRRSGAALLSLIHDRIGEDAFTGPALFAAVLNDPTPAGCAIRELMTAPGEEDAGMRSFGKLLARLDGVALAGFRLVPAGARRDGRAWRVVQVSGSGNPHL